MKKIESLVQEEQKVVEKHKDNDQIHVTDDIQVLQKNAELLKKKSD